MQSTVTLRSLLPELLPQLFHDEFNIRKNARRVLSYGSDMQIGDLENALIHVVESPTEQLRVGDTMLFGEGGSPEELKKRKLAAIRALAVLEGKGTGSGTRVGQIDDRRRLRATHGRLCRSQQGAGLTAHG